MLAIWAEWRVVTFTGLKLVSEGRLDIQLKLPFDVGDFLKKNWLFKYPKNPDPSKMAILRTYDLYTPAIEVQNPSVGGSEDS